MTPPTAVSLADQTRDQLAARVTNYEEGMAQVRGILQDVSDAVDAVVLLDSLLEASGLEHLKAIRDFEGAVTAVLAFKDRVLAEATHARCPLCGGTEGVHTPDCLVGTALRIQPEMLPAYAPTAVVTLAGFRARIEALLSAGPSEDLPGALRQALQDYPTHG